MNHPKFGDRIEGVYASRDNPLKFGTFVCLVKRRHGAMNPGTYYRVTNERGDFWEYPAESCINHGSQREAAVAKLVEDMKAIREALDDALGDSDPYIDEDMSDYDIRAEEPLYWASTKISAALDEFHGRKA